MPRNFHIAKLLVQHGASVNHRVPEVGTVNLAFLKTYPKQLLCGHCILLIFQTEFGSEYLSPGKTGLELVVDLYTQLTLHPCHAALASAQCVATKCDLSVTDISMCLALQAPACSTFIVNFLILGRNSSLTCPQTLWLAWMGKWSMTRQHLWMSVLTSSLLCWVKGNVTAIVLCAIWQTVGLQKQKQAVPSQFDEQQS